MNSPVDSAAGSGGAVGVRPCIRCRPGTRVVIVDHVLAGLTGTVLSIDRYGQINLRIDDVDTSPVTVREQHLRSLDESE